MNAVSTVTMIPTNLHIYPAMAAVPEGAEGVPARGWVEVTAGGDGVLPAVGRGTVTPRQGVTGVVIVSETYVNKHRVKPVI